MIISATIDNHLIHFEIRDLDDKNVKSYEINSNVVSIVLKDGTNVDFNLRDGMVRFLNK